MLKINELVEERYETDRRFYPTKMGPLALPQVEHKLSNKERSFLDLAVKVSETSDVNQKHGAVLVKNGRVLALGVNKWRNRDLRQDNYQPVLTTHAEIDALARVADASGAILYIARTSEKGINQFSRPCFRCMKTIADKGIKRVVYTVD